MKKATKDDLFQPLPTGQSEISGIGVVQIRGLNRDETFEVQNLEDLKDFEARVLMYGLYEMDLNLMEASKLRETRTGHQLEQTINDILRLSGMLRTAVEDAEVPLSTAQTSSSSST